MILKIMKEGNNYWMLDGLEMVSVNHVRDDNGIECVCFDFLKRNGEYASEYAYDTTVYIMNDSGKTIQTIAA